MIFVFIWLTSLSMVVSKSIHVAANDIILLFFMANIPLCVCVCVCVCVYISHLFYPLICQRTFRLFLCLGYCK